MDIDTGRRLVKVHTQSRGKVYRYTFDRDGDDLYLTSREEADDPGTGRIPNYSQGPQKVTSTVRDVLNARGFSVHESGQPSSGNANNGGGLFF